jgi:hypothetical protein
MIRRVLVALAASAAVALPAAAPAPVVATPTAHAACTQAKIRGKSKCIAAGQFCSRQDERDYNKYGYTCNKRDRNGRWHLSYR